MKNAFANLRSFLFISLLLLNANGYGQSISGIINSYYRINGINIVPNTVTVTSAAGLSPGMKILIIQSKGAAINTTNTNSFGSLDAIGNAGNYEFNFICGIAGNNVLLQYELRNTYDVPGLVQLIPVPQFASVTVTDTLKPMPWDPVSGTGGVLIMELSDTLHLNNVIDASAAGFTGAA
ncbi:MAG: hypothetical protein H7Y31_08570, partial [Chitinophagaceae bacterium]|nr:hypothetical protein [Chitinophagaceae bacterium]